jgi:hypothetical protein
MFGKISHAPIRKDFHRTKTYKFTEDADNLESIEESQSEQREDDDNMV